MNDIVVFDIGTTHLKIMIFSGDKPIDYKVFKIDNVEGKIEPRKIVEIVSSYSKRYKSFIITGQRASILGWNDVDDYSYIYTWRSTEAESLREKYIDPNDELLNLFVRPGSGALRIKYVQEMGFKYVGGVETFVVWLLTGKYLVDHAYAHTFGLYDPFSLTYLDAVVESLKIDMSRLPEPVDSFTADISNDKQVLAMIPDQSASLISEYEGENTVKVTLGTGAFLDVYTSSDILGDPFQGINPMLSFIHRDVPRYMSEAFIYNWGTSLDKFLVKYGYAYEDVDKIDFKDLEYTPYSEVLRSTFNPSIKEIHREYTLKDITLSLAGCVSYMILKLRELRDFDRVSLNGGGARSRIIPYLIANSSNVNVKIRSQVEKASLYGGYIYYLMRMGDETEKYVNLYRPVERIIEGSDEFISIVETYRDSLN